MENFIVQCNCCMMQYDNWVGSTPCCGSIAFRVDENGKKTDEVILFGSLNGSETKKVIIKIDSK